MIKTYEEFLNEGKQVGILYHYTNLEAAENIVKTDELHCGEEEQTIKCVISFTRNKNFHKNVNYLPQLQKNAVCFVIDGDKLSNNYKLKPFQFDPFYGEDEDSLADWDKDDLENWRRNFDEDEERISFGYKGKIKNISKYIIDIKPIRNVSKRDVNDLKYLLKGN